MVESLEELTEEPDSTLHNIKHSKQLEENCFAFVIKINKKLFTNRSSATSKEENCVIQQRRTRWKAYNKQCVDNLH